MAVADWFRIVLLSLVWGGSFFFIEVMLEAMPPMTSVLGRLMVGLIGLLILLKILGYRLESTHRTVAILCIHWPY